MLRSCILILSFALFSTSLWSQIDFTESVEYDSANQRFLLSNSSNILARDLDGNFSVFGSESASHGMEVLDNTLFALEGDVVKGFDLTTEAKVMEFTIPGAIFLNGITSNGSNLLWISDFSGKSIFSLDVSDLSMPSYALVTNTIATPNGLWYDSKNDRLLFVTWGNSASVKAVNLMDNTISTVVNTSLGNIDGIAQDKEGQYYLSSWSPDVITIYDEDFANAPTTLMTPSLNSPADIGLAKEPGILGIPMGSSVVFVELEMEEDTMNTSVVETAAQDIRLAIHGNPLQVNSLVYYELTSSEQLSIDLLDIKGQIIQSLYRGNQNPGKHWISLAGVDLASGTYLLQLRAGAQQLSQRLTVLPDLD